MNLTPNDPQYHQALSGFPILAPGDRFLRLPAVCDVIGMGRTWVTDRVREHAFPQPVRLGCTVVWLESQVRVWMAERVAESQARTA